MPSSKLSEKKVVSLLGSLDLTDPHIPEANYQEAKQVKLELFNHMHSIQHTEEEEDRKVAPVEQPEKTGPKSDFVPSQVIKYLNSKRFDNDRRHAFTK